MGYVNFSDKVAVESLVFEKTLKRINITDLNVTFAEANAHRLVENRNQLKIFRDSDPCNGKQFS